MRVFGDPGEWPDSDLVALSEDLTPEAVLAGLAEGVFPMPLYQGQLRGRVGWWSPVARAVFEPGALRVPRSLRKSAKRYRCTVDEAFARVLDSCADPSREGAWIDARIKRTYRSLHRLGHAHSVEVWDADGGLVGGLYGVNRGALFAGESMFHTARDASKVALVHLAGLLSEVDGALIDAQWQTDHLASLGALEISRDDYLAEAARLTRLPDALSPLSRPNPRT